MIAAAQLLSQCRAPVGRTESFWFGLHASGGGLYLRLFDEVAQPAQHLHRLPTRRVEQRIGQALIADHIELPVIARTLQQRLDLGEAGVEMLAVEGVRFSVTMPSSSSSSTISRTRSSGMRFTRCFSCSTSSMTALLCNRSFTCGIA